MVDWEKEEYILAEAPHKRARRSKVGSGDRAMRHIGDLDVQLDHAKVSAGGTFENSLDQISQNESFEISRSSEREGFEQSHHSKSKAYPHHEAHTPATTTYAQTPEELGVDQALYQEMLNELEQAAADEETTAHNP